jgi:hypothetical protein
MHSRLATSWDFLRLKAGAKTGLNLSLTKLKNRLMQAATMGVANTSKRRTPAIPTMRTVQGVF